MHGKIKIAAIGRLSPTRRINPRRALQRIHRQAAIIGQSRQACRGCCGQGFKLGIGDKGRAGFLRLGQTQRIGTERFNLKARQ